MKRILTSTIEELRGLYPTIVFFMSAGFATLGFARSQWLATAIALVGFIWAKDMISTRAASKAKEDLLRSLMDGIMTRAKP